MNSKHNIVKTVNNNNNNDNKRSTQSIAQGFNANKREKVITLLIIWFFCKRHFSVKANFSFKNVYYIFGQFNFKEKQKLSQHDSAVYI